MVVILLLYGYGLIGRGQLCYVFILRLGMGRRDLCAISGTGSFEI